MALAPLSREPSQRLRQGQPSSLWPPDETFTHPMHYVNSPDAAIRIFVAGEMWNRHCTTRARSRVNSASLIDPAFFSRSSFSISSAAL
jgi:hypothetical protein